MCGVGNVVCVAVCVELVCVLIMCREECPGISCVWYAPLSWFCYRARLVSFSTRD